MSRQRSNRERYRYEDRIKERESRNFSIWDSSPSPSVEKSNSGDDKERRKRMSSPIHHKDKRKTNTSSRRRVTSSTSRSNSLESKKSRHCKKKERLKVKPSKRKRYSSSDSSSSSSERDCNLKRGDSKIKTILESKQVDSLDVHEAQKFKAAVQNRSHEVEDECIGPKPLAQVTDTNAQSMNYGSALMPGEGQAIAQFVQKNMRIPRRGEVGWDGGEIENLETLGYVMSGSRHKRMNAIRIRKENQVYSAEEKRALALINFEEKQQRENKIMGDFRAMLTERLTKKHGADTVEDMETIPSLESK